MLWSDALGLSMLVDAIANPLPEGATESTVLGPFYVPGAPLRGYGESIALEPAGVPAWVHGRILDLTGAPIAGAELDVWQNGDNELYAVQDADAEEDHLRGRFHTREDGTYAFVGVRPAPYAIPHDGPVGQMLAATGRHPWRPAHIHLIVRAHGLRARHDPHLRPRRAATSTRMRSSPSSRPFCGTSSSATRAIRRGRRASTTGGARSRTTSCSRLRAED